MEKITKDKFDAYKVVRDSGITNMMAMNYVIQYANQICDVILTKEDCYYIMEHYAELKEKYGGL